MSLPLPYAGNRHRVWMRGERGNSERIETFVYGHSTHIHSRRPAIIGAWLVTLISFVLAACGGGATGSSAPTTAPTQPVATAATPATAAATKPTAAPTTASTPAIAAAGATTAATTSTGTTAASTAVGTATKPATGTTSTAATIAGPNPDEAKTLTGAGATFPAPLYTKWFNEYEKVTRVKVNYQAIGSGGGIKGITDKTVDFGASDGPMTDEQLKAAPGDILHIPMTLGSDLATYNVPEAKDALKFTGDTLAGIFLGTITKWNDPKLTADNPQLGSVNKDITVVHRSDGSGTTYVWTDYLSTVSPEWKSKVGKSTSVNWPVGLGAKGNDGVTGEIKQNPYSIGYVELVYAMQNKLPVSSVKNKAGKFVTPSIESVTTAAAGVADKLAPDLRVSIVDAEGDTAYPISSFTWLLVYKDQPDKAKAIALTRMIWWATHEGQQFSAALFYAPLPAGVVQKDEEKITSITVGGQPAFTGK